ncbi:uncharacterized protein [Watersipora subatra]|uniref:uncharacterized protein n=1 Tax=Watersipora subatra TaxID=2589382 RepID=UPI00355BC1D2
MSLLFAHTPLTLLLTILPQLKKFHPTSTPNRKHSLLSIPDSVAATAPPQKPTFPAHHSDQVEPGSLNTQIFKHEAKVEGSTVTLLVEERRSIFMFESSQTVGVFTRDVQHTIGYECVISSQDGFQYTDAVLLGALILPFTFSAGDSKTIITSRGDVEQVDARCLHRIPVHSSTSKLSKFSRVTSIKQVIELFTTVHEQVKSGRTINAALKEIGKDRKTIERFKNIYYLNLTSSNRLSELEREWSSKDKKGTLQDLNKMAEAAIDWSLLEKLAEEGKATLFGAINKN